MTTTRKKERKRKTRNPLSHSLCFALSECLLGTSVFFFLIDRPMVIQAIGGMIWTKKWEQIERVSGNRKNEDKGRESAFMHNSSSFLFPLSERKKIPVIMKHRCTTAALLLFSFEQKRRIILWTWQSWPIDWNYPLIDASENVWPLRSKGRPDYQGSLLWPSGRIRQELCPVLPMHRCLPWESWIWMNH